MEAKVMSDNEIVKIKNLLWQPDKESDELINKIIEISFDAGIREAIKVYTPYVKALEEENGSLVGFASTHGWSSSQVEFGGQCRDRIKRLKARSKPNPRNGR